MSNANVVCVCVCVVLMADTHTKRFSLLRSILSSLILQHWWTLLIQQTPAGSASASWGNNFTCMWVTNLLAPQLSTLYSNVSSSYMKYRSDATSFPFCLISVSSHHSHYLPPGYFSRCGVLVALLSAQGRNSPWHVALRPVAETRTNHLSLSRRPRRSHWNWPPKPKTYFSFQTPCAQIASPLSRIARQQPPAIRKRSHVYKLHPAKVRRLSLQLHHG